MSPASRARFWMALTFLLIALYRKAVRLDVPGYDRARAHDSAFTDGDGTNPALTRIPQDYRSVRRCGLLCTP